MFSQLANSQNTWESEQQDRTIVERERLKVGRMTKEWKNSGLAVLAYLLKWSSGRALCDVETTSSNCKTPWL